MKSISILGLLCGILILFVCSCETKDDSLNVKTDVNSSEQKKPELSCQELLNTPEDFAGKKVTLNAISWGTSTSVDGEEILMSIDDELLVGMQQAHVLVHFTKDQKEEIENIEENDSISLKATVGEYESGALRLTEAIVSSKKD